MATQKQPVTFLTSEEVIGLPYTPALLLEGRFDASITDDPAFSDGCGTGFNGYYDVLSDGLEGYCPVSEMRRFMVELVTTPGGGPVWLDQRSGFRWQVGYGLGWLSALARSQYQEATKGLKLLMQLVERSEDK
jgi:hypothetical protein